MNNLQLWSSETEVLPISHFTSLGLSEETAESLYIFQLVLSTKILKNNVLITKLKQLKAQKDDWKLLTERGQNLQPPSNGIEQEFAIMIKESSALPEGLLIHHTDLLPLWQTFAATLMDLSAFEDTPNICLSIGNVELHDDVLDILVPALSKIPLSKVVLLNNRLGRSVNFITLLLQASSSIEALSMDNNYMKYNHEDAELLANTLSKHPSLKVVHFRGGCIECNEKMVAAIVPSIFKNLSSLSLCGSNLGTQDIKLITNCLATNPLLYSLFLNDLGMGDIEAILLADQALKRNTNLLKLNLCGNNFTEVGVKALITSVYDDINLNAVYDSNATCRLSLDDIDTIDSGDKSILCMNREGNQLIIDDAPENVLFSSIMNIEQLHIEGSRRIKILYALFGGNSSLQTHYLNDVPIELMPRVISYIDEGSKWTGVEEKKLDRLFQLVLSRPDSMVSFAVTHQKEEKKQYELSLESKIIAIVVAAVSAFVGIITATTIRWYHDA